MQQSDSKMWACELQIEQTELWATWWTICKSIHLQVVKYISVHIVSSSQMWQSKFVLKVLFFSRWKILKVFHVSSWWFLYFASQMFKNVTAIFAAPGSSSFSPIFEITRSNILTVCSCHVTYAFQSESTLYSCLNVKELLASSRCKIFQLLSLKVSYNLSAEF